MHLNLDARQRAMLQEMGITVWLPQQIPASDAAICPKSPNPTATSPAVQTTAASKSAVPHLRQPSPDATVGQAHAMLPPTPSNVTWTGLDAEVWNIAPAVRLYAPGAGNSVPDNAQGSNDGWLLLLEDIHPVAPLTGDIGRLLNNMLRALRLQHHPQVWVAAMQRPHSTTLSVVGNSAPANWQPLSDGLTAVLTQTTPARILVLGLHTARAILQRTEPLGQLRAHTHTVQNVPTIVSYDPAYLLRAPHAKPAAWTDLCRAYKLGQQKSHR